MKPTALVTRLSAVAILSVAMVSLRLQYDVAGGVPGLADPTARLWRMAAYFTVLTNVLVALTMLVVGLRIGVGAVWAAAITLSITMVGIVYHLVLARLWAPEGLAFWADQGLHTAVPLMTLAWWWLCAPKDITLRHVPILLIWPMTYCVYAVVRGLMTGFWAYPFVDVVQLGWGRAILNMTGLIVTFAVLGMGLVLAAQRKRD